ncbi:hypothetical protein BCD96_000023 [Clostridium beijerinckii]|uniref:hypothetical protein n=1 Tax=Clostridium beijerinckii TaxID=1520 RepID=UPI001F4C26C5|nr:hypothetical protein [Clostridium beijerinckii]NSA95130.1 hypothetical protein [Clostridium beijerinckii]
MLNLIMINLAVKKKFIYQVNVVLMGIYNVSFINNVIKELLKICKEHAMEKEKIDVGFLMDPCHEELHHSYYLNIF